MRVLVVNAGSSSLKLSVIDEALRVLDSEGLDLPDGHVDAAAVQHALARLPAADAAGHRVVHGGPWYAGPVRIDAAVEARMAELRSLAPLHEDRALAGLATVRGARPQLPEVACFDTAFHAGLPAAASTYALSQEWITRPGLRRYGFSRTVSRAHRPADRRAAGARRPADRLRPPRRRSFAVRRRSRSAAVDAARGRRLPPPSSSTAWSIAPGSWACRGPRTCASCWPVTTTARAPRSPSMGIGCVLDVNMGAASSLPTVPQLRLDSPETAIVVLTMQSEPAFARQALQSRASAHVLKDAAEEELVHAVRAAARGEIYLNPQLGARLASEIPAPAELPPSELTSREIDVLHLIALGNTNNEIAGELYLSVRTIQSHRSHIQLKLGRTTRAELVRYALDHGLLDAARPAVSPAQPRP
jgi:two-component system response regulator NreC